MVSDFIIIGSGIIGLTLAYKLKKKYPDCKITILEKETNSISHGSGRNSGVIHSGIYYQPGSLRAKLCVSGSVELKNYIKKNNLWIHECGKILVANADTSYGNLDFLYDRGIKNGVKIERITKEEAEKLEPNLKSSYPYCLFVPFTSIADPKEVSSCLIKELKDLGVNILYGEKVLNIIDQNQVVITNVGKYSFKHIFNCAGLGADILARNSNIKFRYSFLPFKGKYWKVKNTEFKLNHLVYPIPDLEYPFLGLHSSMDKDGNYYLGPSSTPVFGREAYDGFFNSNLKEFLELFFSFFKKIIFNENQLRTLAFKEFKIIFKSGFLSEVNKMFKNLKTSDLEVTNKKIGIRSQIFDPNSKTLVNDFVILHEKYSTHIINAISPAWSASFAFADHIIENSKV